MANVASVGVPPGTKIDFCGSSPPAGYLACDGAVKLIADYPALYAAIGLIWQPDSPPPSGSFNLPLLYTRVCAGAGGAGIPLPGPTTIVDVGDVGGTSARNIAYQEMPPHNHAGAVLQTRQIALEVV